MLAVVHTLVDGIENEPGQKNTTQRKIQLVI
jgi:hypothetical protein